MSTLGRRIEPFRGLLFNPQVTGDPKNLVAPPYDLIDAAHQDELYRRSPYNVVRLELGREEDRYGAARRALDRWIREGALRRSARPALYLYTQRFEVEGRRLGRAGFVVRIRLEPYSHGLIEPHERTFPGPKRDRMRLLGAIHANVSPIFGLYPAGLRRLDRLREAVAAREPIIRVADDLGIVNELRSIEAPDEIAVVQRELESARILIADGHHRYETALEYAQRTRAENPGAASPAPWDYTMMSLVAADDPGLVILPTHRVALRLDPEAIRSFRNRAERWFHIEEVSSREALMSKLRERGPGTLGVALKGLKNPLMLTLRDPDAMAAELPGVASELRGLDVMVLHAIVLERVLGLGAEEIRGGVLEYTIDADSALAKVAAGKIDGAFLMNPPSPHDVERVADSGATMPEKSTYFYPKLLTGLVMYPLEDPPSGA